MKRRSFFSLAGWAASSGLMLRAATVAAQASYPSRPISLVVPYAPGGATDLLGRIVAKKLSESLGVPVAVVNRGGAGGNIGADSVAKAVPDGYTLLVGTIGTHAINSSLYRSMPFNPQKDFTPIGLMLTNQLVLLVNPSLPIKTVSELIAYSKQNGSKLFFGSAGNGSSHHLAGELLKAQSGLQMTHVPYKGSGPALVDLMGGTVQVLFVDIAGALPHIRAGKIRALAVGGRERSALLPELPTIAEAAKLPGFEVSAWMGVFAPAGTPEPIVARVNAALTELLPSPDVRAGFAELGAEPWPSTPQALAAHVRSEGEKWARIVKATGLSLD